MQREFFTRCKAHREKDMLTLLGVQFYRLVQKHAVVTTATVRTPNTSLIPQLFPASCTADPVLTPRPWKPTIHLLFLVFPMSECPNWNHTVWGLLSQLLLYTCSWDSLCSIRSLFFSAAEGYSTAVSLLGPQAKGKLYTPRHVFLCIIWVLFPEH